jgi:hypothetical protein
VVNADGLEVLDLGPVDAPDTAWPAGKAGVGADADRHHVTRRGLLTVAGLGLAGGLGLSVRHRGPPPVEQPQPRPAPAVTPSVAPAPQVATPGPFVSDLGGPLLGGPPVDVFGLLARGVVRIELATGRLTRTRLPPTVGGDVSFVPFRGGVLVHRGDFGSVYVVPDGRAPRPAPTGLAGIGPMLPGPDPDHVWVVRRPGTPPPYLVLLDVRGRTTGTAVPLPAFATTPPVPDRSGFSLVSSVGGTYWVGPGGLRRVTTGAVVASGPSGWLAVECDDRSACSAVLVARDGGRRPVRGVLEPSLPAGDLSTPFGALSPDGRSAAFYVQDRGGGVRLVVLDVSTGRRTHTELALVTNPEPDTFAWLPDGSRLLALDSSARILAVDPATGNATPLVPSTAVRMPVVSRMAIR